MAAIVERGRDGVLPEAEVFRLPVVDVLRAVVPKDGSAAGGVVAGVERRGCRTGDRKGRDRTQAADEVPARIGELPLDRDRTALLERPVEADGGEEPTGEVVDVDGSGVFAVAAVLVNNPLVDRVNPRGRNREACRGR